MGKSKYTLQITVFCFKLLIEIANFICVFILVSSSRKNPFEKHIIGNLTNYFYFYDEGSTSFLNINKRKNNNVLFNNNSTEEHIFNRSKKISSNLNIKKELFLRKLVAKSFCLEILDNFEKCRGTKLSNIFDLNYNRIHTFSITTLVLSLVFFLLLIVNICLIYARSYFDK